MSAPVVYDPGNELIVLRAIVADPEKRRVLVHALSDSEFLVPAHAAAFRALRAMTDGGLEYTTAAMVELLRRESSDDAVVSELEAGGVAQNLPWHVQTLKWDATRVRVLTDAVPEVIKELQDPKASVERTVSAARALVRALEGGGGRRYIHRPSTLARGYKAEIADRRERGNFYPTMYAPADEKLTEGLMPTKTSVVAGLSGSGKSTFVANLAIQLANAKRKILMCVWEMGAYSILDVMVSSILRIELKRIVQGTITMDEQVRVNWAVDWVCSRIRFMENAFFEKVTSGKRSNARNQDIFEGYLAEAGCDLVIMDLWERMLADLSYDGVTTALYRQQDMHKEYNVHGMIVHQLRGKDVEKRPDKRPTRESIKGTGAFVEVADLIFGVHRDAQFKDVPDDTLELICLKQRKGEAFWAVRFDWDGSLSRIAGGEQVPYDPGLESSSEFGDLSEIKTSSRKRRSQKMGRRDD